MTVNVLVCPCCAEVNNVSNTELVNSPSCNACEQALLPGVAIEVDKELFKQFITHSSLPIVVNFWGPWSGKSQEMAEEFGTLADTFKKDALFLKINSEQEQVLANNYKLIDIPTFILFKSGSEYHRMQGLITGRYFHDWLERYLRVKRKKTTHHPSSV